MKKLLILLFLSFFSTMLLAQISLDVKSKKISFFEKIEKENEELEQKRKELAKKKKNKAAAVNMVKAFEIIEIGK